MISSARWLEDPSPSLAISTGCFISFLFYASHVYNITTRYVNVCVRKPQVHILYNLTLISKSKFSFIFLNTQSKRCDLLSVQNWHKVIINKNKSLIIWCTTEKMKCLACSIYNLLYDEWFCFFSLFFKCITH